MKVSICVVAYNTEAYIGEALQSILKQKVNFKYEIIIREDVSTDKTLEKCREFQKQYPDIIKVFPNEKNLKYSFNFYSALRDCTGEYIAVLDSDDFWTDENKLQTQVDFLDQNPEYSLCFSRYHLAEENGNLVSVTGKSGKFNFYDVLKGSCPGTRTVMFRRKYLPEVPGHVIKNIIYSDQLLFSMIMRNGPAFSFEKPMAAYRMSTDSIYTSKTLERKSLNSIYNYYLISEVFGDKKSRDAIQKGIAFERIKLQRYYFFTGNPVSLVQNSIKLIVSDIKLLDSSFFKSCFIILKYLIKTLTGRINLQRART